MTRPRLHGQYLAERESEPRSVIQTFSVGTGILFLLHIRALEIETTARGPKSSPRLFCMACELRMIFTFLNSWKKIESRLFDDT